MAEFGRGIKAGIVSGIIYGIIIAILGAIVAYAYWDAIVASFESVLPGFGVIAGSITITTYVIGALVGGVIGGIIGGIIFGLIYAALYNSLPGSTSIIKGIVLAIIFWLIFSIALGYGNINFISMEYFVVNNVIMGLIGSLIWGTLLGKFWDKFAPAGA